MAETPEERADRENREEEVRQAEEARRLLEHPILVACLDAIVEQHQRTWLNSAEDDVKGRETAYRMLRSAADFRRLLTRLIESGDIAAEQLALLIAQREAEGAVEIEPI